MRTQTSTVKRRKSTGMKAKKPVKRTIKLSAKRTPGKRMKFTANLSKAKGKSATSRKPSTRKAKSRKSQGLSLKGAILHPRSTLKKVTQQLTQ